MLIKDFLLKYHEEMAELCLPLIKKYEASNPDVFLDGSMLNEYLRGRKMLGGDVAWFERDLLFCESVKCPSEELPLHINASDEELKGDYAIDELLNYAIACLRIRHEISTLDVDNG